MPTLLDTIAETIARHAMIQAGDKILAAVSGGPDSICLLNALLTLGHNLEVAHLDHGTRNGESAEDAKFVEAKAQELGIPIHLEVRDIVREALLARQSFENYARTARYDFLTRIAHDRGCAAIATGHHAGDQVETLLMRFVRGTSPRGLAGIPPVQDHLGIRVIRPLLACQKVDILGYLDCHRVAYRSDHSNTDTRFRRNQIRHGLLPTLEREYNPRVREALERLAIIQRDENGLMEDLANAFLDSCVTQEGYIARAAFADGHPALQRRALTLLGWRHGVDCPFDIVEAARRAVLDAAAGHEVDLGSGLRLRITRRVAEFETASEKPGPSEVQLSLPGETTAFEKRFLVRYRMAPLEGGPARHCTPRCQLFDADALGESLVVRHRLPGDRFTPLGMTGTRKLKDYFIDMGMPSAARSEQLILTANGRIAWIIGHAISAHAAVTPETRNVIEIEVCNALV
ncbi:MAG: tRNA lysidine(34) synthetase TilS [Candidatus Hydrogenedentes bacterium]|nr:tRNA lysidine(34) synthetase TilS [Candidatus Hydrogenedentota bacterium]